MSRGLTTAVKNALAGTPTFCHLVYLGFATPVRKTDNSFDIVDDIEGSSQTYNADGTLLGVGHVPESNTPIKNSIDLIFSGVDQSLISTVLNNDVLGVDIKVYRAVISGTTAIADPFLLFHGNLSNFQINDGGATASLSITATNHFGNFEKINGRTTADTSQQRHFASDKGFEFSALTIRDIKWGRE
mgnify:FL=1|tara:strand:+ start:256 stop:816 length:561 start_codon:yes stop_codon:yes gene_type:complete